MRNNLCAFFLSFFFNESYDLGRDYDRRDPYDDYRRREYDDYRGKCVCVFFELI